MNKSISIISDAAALIKARHFEEAIQLIKPFLKDEPSNIMALGMLASVYAEINMHEKARDLYNQILKLEPSNALARFQLGLTYFNNKDYSTAIKTWEPALDDKTDFMSKYFTGLSLLCTNNLQRGTEFLEAAQKIMPEDHPLYSQLHQHISNAKNIN